MEYLRKNSRKRIFRRFVFNNVFDNVKKRCFFSGLIHVPKMLFVLFSFLFLTSCSLLMRSGSQMTVRILSANYLNPDIYGRPSPVVITIYQLKSRFAFEQADYESLSSNPAKVLSNDLIDRDTIEVRPETEKSVLKTLSGEARYLGIVAEYRNIHQTVWRRLIKIIPAKGKQAVLSIQLESQSFTAHLSHKYFIW